MPVLEVPDMVRRGQDLHGERRRRAAEGRAPAEREVDQCVHLGRVLHVLSGPVVVGSHKEDLEVEEVKGSNSKLSQNLVEEIFE